MMQIWLRNSAFTENSYRSNKNPGTGTFLPRWTVPYSVHIPHPQHITHPISLNRHSQYKDVPCSILVDKLWKLLFPPFLTDIIYRDFPSLTYIIYKSAPPFIKILEQDRGYIRIIRKIPGGNKSIIEIQRFMVIMDFCSRLHRYVLREASG